VVTQGHGCTSTIQGLATTTERQTGASRVVVIDMGRVRHSHPEPPLIGQPVGEPITTRDSGVHLGFDPASKGRSAYAKAPLSGPDGIMVGEVSIGIGESSVSSAPWRELPSDTERRTVALGLGGSR
jgi:two-component system CitB family sensor kinase